MLTYSILRRLLAKGYQLPTNVSLINDPAEAQWDEFRAVLPDFPGEDRHVTLCYDRQRAQQEGGSAPAAWAVLISDQDDFGQAYSRHGRECLTLEQALALPRTHPWTPPIARMLTLMQSHGAVRTTTQELSDLHRDITVLLFADGAFAPITIGDDEKSS